VLGRGVTDNSAVEPPEVALPPHNRRKIAANFVGTTLIGFLSVLVGMLISVYVRRRLGPVATGQINWNVAVLSYLGLITNPGLQLIGQREISRRPANSEQITSLILSLQTLFSLATYGLVLAIAVLNLRGKQVSYLLVIQGISLFLTAWSTGWVLRARERMIAPAIAGLLLIILQFPFLIALVRGPQDVFLSVILDLSFSLLNVAYGFWYLKRNALLKFSQLHATVTGAQKILAESWPLALSQGAILIYYNCDAIILGFTDGDNAVGQYTTAYKLMLVATVLSSALWNAYLPTFSRMRDIHNHGSHASTEFASLLAWIGFPIAILGWSFGRHVVSLVYGVQFQESGLYFEWLCLNIALIFASISVGSPLMVWGMQKMHLVITGIGALVNLGLNLLIIPIYGAWGAIVTTLTAEFLVFILVVIARYRKGISLPPMLAIFLPPLFCCAVVGGGFSILPRVLDRYWWIECAVGIIVLGCCFYFFQRRIAAMAIQFLHETYVRKKRRLVVILKALTVTHD
jgi:O-antigen/teichoic acid export membrane protein